MHGYSKACRLHADIWTKRQQFSNKTLCFLNFVQHKKSKKKWRLRRTKPEKKIQFVPLKLDTMWIVENGSECLLNDRKLLFVMQWKAIVFIQKLLNEMLDMVMKTPVYISIYAMLNVLFPKWMNHIFFLHIFLNVCFWVVNGFYLDLFYEIIPFNKYSSTYISYHKIRFIFRRKRFHRIYIC